MIQSMTAFARAQHQGSWGSAIIELRSVNHRYLEMYVNVPDTLNGLEASLREKIRHHLSRGKIECYLRYQPSKNDGSELIINTHLAEQLCRAHKIVAERVNNAAVINTMDVLRWPGLLQIPELGIEAIQEAVLAILETALQDLISARQREGEGLKQLFLQRLESMKVELGKVRQHLPEILKEQRERLIKRFADAKVELDSNRLEQEMVMFAQKTDVAEELDRLDAHISEVRRVLKHGGVVGRRLDFLMQELNREANTLGSKSVDVDTTRVSVELKVLIEQMREQVQNVE